jgi:uncharacterized membrane protein YeiB
MEENKDWQRLFSIIVKVAVVGGILSAFFADSPSVLADILTGLGAFLLILFSLTSCFMVPDGQGRNLKNQE